MGMQLCQGGLSDTLVSYSHWVNDNGVANMCAHKDEQHIGVIVVTRLPCVRMNTIIYYRMIVKMR